MENERIFDPNKLNIVDFKLVKGEISAKYDFETDEIDRFNTDLSFNASVDPENKVIKAEIGFEIETVSNNDQEEAIAKFTLVYLYEVENLDLIFDNGNDESEERLKGELNLMVAIGAISFSTSRGILMTRLQGTVMKDYILPVIDPGKLYESVEDKIQ